MKYLLIFTVLCLAACSQAPKLAAGKAGIYGTLSADAHSEFKAKHHAHNDATGIYSSSQEQGLLPYQDRMVDYEHLANMYVGLVLPQLTPQQHTLTINAESISPPGTALAPNDILNIENQSGKAQTFFIAQTQESGGAVQELARLAHGEKGSYPLQLAGQLELLSEDDDKLKAVLYARKNMLSKRIKSGDSYQFTDLEPTNYDIVFWHWRLGKIEQHITLKPNESLQIDQVLSVDRLQLSK